MAIIIRLAIIVMKASGLYIKTSIKNNWIKLKDEVGMAVPKSTQTRFVELTYHIHYTSLRLLFSSILAKCPGISGIVLENVDMSRSPGTTENCPGSLLNPVWPSSLTFDHCCSDQTCKLSSSLTSKVIQRGAVDLSTGSRQSSLNPASKK